MFSSSFKRFPTNALLRKHVAPDQERFALLQECTADLRKQQHQHAIKKKDSVDDVGATNDTANDQEKSKFKTRIRNSPPSDYHQTDSDCLSVCCMSVCLHQVVCAVVIVVCVVIRIKIILCSMRGHDIEYSGILEGGSVGPPRGARPSLLGSF